MIFPKDFWWGAATSGPQSEGRFNKKHANVFDHWFEVEPDAFYDQVGPDTALSKFLQQLQRGYRYAERNRPKFFPHIDPMVASDR